MSSRRFLTHADVLTRIRGVVSRARTQGDAAAALGISRPYLVDILKGQRGVPVSVCEAIGVRREVVYVRLPAQTGDET